MKNKIDLDTGRMCSDVVPKYHNQEEFNFGPYFFGPFLINKLHGLDVLCKKYIKPMDTLLEIGSYRGVSTSLFAYYAKHVTAVDLQFQPDFSRFTKDQLNITTIARDCNLYYEKAIERGDKFDIIYIDGDHGTTQFKKDLLSCKKLLKVGGILAGHDFHKIGAAPVMLEVIFEARGDFTKIETFSDSSWAIQYNDLFLT